MLLEVTKSLAEQITKFSKRKINILWHAGEPLACGIDHFQNLLLPFTDLINNGKVSFGIQTNGTLLNDDWCEMFKKYKFEIGVSLDGPKWANQNRVDWNGNQKYEQTLRGISILKKYEIPFGIIAVIQEESLGKANEIYDFFCSIDCQWLGINIEEKLGVNNSQIIDKEKVKIFWQGIITCWIKKPKLNIRDLTEIIEWVNDVSRDVKVSKNLIYDIFPTINYKGDVVLFSPEFSDMNSRKYGSFKVRNIIEENLFDLLNNLQGIEYVNDFIESIHSCESECEYFGLCKGGQASNKYFENGTAKSTETNYCINSFKIPANSIINYLNT